MSSELERRASAFLQEFSADAAFDSEFSPNPYRPHQKMATLAALGAVAAPVIASHLDSSSRDLRRIACYGARRLGPAGTSLLPALERLLTDEWCGGAAAAAIARIDPPRFWASGLHRFSDAVQSLMDDALESGAGSTELLERLVALDDARPLVAALGTLDRFVTCTRRGRPFEPGLLIALRRCTLSAHEEVRRRATHVLGKLPGAPPGSRPIPSPCWRSSSTS